MLVSTANRRLRFRLELTCYAVLISVSCSIFTEGSSKSNPPMGQYRLSYPLSKHRKVFPLLFSERGWKTAFTYVMKLFLDKYLVINSVTSEMMEHLKHISSGSCHHGPLQSRATG